MIYVGIFVVDTGGENSGIVSAYNQGRNSKVAFFFVWHQPAPQMMLSVVIVRTYPHIAGGQHLDDYFLPVHFLEQQVLQRAQIVC